MSTMRRLTLSAVFTLVATISMAQPSVTPAQGPVDVNFTKTATRRDRDRDLVVTTIQVTNPTTTPIARLTITEKWFEEDGTAIADASRTGVVDGLLQPGDVQTITIETPYHPKMRKNIWLFSHANGTVQPHRIESVDSPATALPEKTFQLALLATARSTLNDNNIIEGQVKNVSGQSLKDVTAVVTFRDRNGGFVRADEALIGANPILPEQSSPFKVMSTGNPAIATFVVDFKVPSGGTLTVDDQRKDKQ